MPTLLICVEGSASLDDARLCAEHFEADIARRDWAFQPGFVDQLDAVAVNAPDDLPALRTVGVAMSLPPLEHSTDEEAVREDVAALITSMSGLARQAGIDFVVEYDEEAIGFLDGGADDASLLAHLFGGA